MRSSTAILLSALLPAITFSAVAEQQNKLLSTCFFGFVEDAKGVRVSGAAITVGSASLSGSRVTHSDADGKFCISSMPAAPYWIFAEAEGLRIPKKLELNVGIGFKVPLLLRLEPTTQSAAPPRPSDASRARIEIEMCHCLEQLKALVDAQLPRP